MQGDSSPHAVSIRIGDLRWWAGRIREGAAQGREMFNCFNNDGHGHAVRKAETLRGMLRC